MTNDANGLKANLALTLGAVGVVYGDIGTSPIYAFKESLHAAGSDRFAVYGVLSLILWTLITVVSLKYLVFVVRADNNGEGGILALFALLPQKIKSAHVGKYKSVVFIIFIAAAFLFADGLLTPAISVVSAIEGLNTVNAGFSAFVLPISLVILGTLFAVQFKGTHRIGKIFGPVMLVWFAVIAALGTNQIFMHPEILEAINPIYALNYIAHVNWQIFVVLSCVILAATGAEALYADLGHFGKRPIRIGWFGIAGLSLVTCYFGQAALVISQPEMSHNPFFGMAGEGVGSILLVALATFATVIASQALISGVASISSQAIHMTLLPRMRIIHTNQGHKGQTYVPFVNAILAAGSIVIVLIFQTSSALAGAYTFAISGTMLITTICIYWVAKETWKVHPIILYPILVIFLLIDLAFVVSTATKIITGAWLPLLIGVTLAGMMWTWRKGRYFLGQQMAQEDISFSQLKKFRSKNQLQIEPGVGIYLSSQSARLPQALQEQIRLLKRVPEKIIVVRIVPVDVPYSDTSANLESVCDWFHRVEIQNGFMESRDVPALLNSELLRTTFEEPTAIYYLTDRTMIRDSEIGLNHAEELVFSALHRNAAKASTFFNLPEKRVLTFDVRMDL